MATRDLKIGALEILVAKRFKEAGMFFVKFNFSHNGGTMEQPIDFPDLEAFAENNYSKELDDLGDVIDNVLSSRFSCQEEVDRSKLSIIGHSRGGGISIIKASEDDRITKLITWSSVADFGRRSSTTGHLDLWRKNGVKYVLNGRTQQQMPHNFQFYKDFKANEARLHIETAEKRLGIPHLIVHGTDDDAVVFSEAEELKTWNNQAELFEVNDANHVYNTKHPWESNDLPKALIEVVDRSIDFISR